MRPRPRCLIDSRLAASIRGCTSQVWPLIFLISSVRTGTASKIAHDSIVSDVEDWRLGIFVDGHDGSGVLHANEMLDGAGIPSAT